MLINNLDYRKLPVRSSSRPYKDYGIVITIDGGEIEA